MDLRYTLRTLRRHPGFAAVAILTLALGIGANTAIFTVFRSVLLRPLPFRDPGRLVAIQEVVPKFAHIAPNIPVNAGHFLEWRRQAHALDQIALIGDFRANLTSAGEPVRIPMARVSAALFPLLGIQPQIGRGFREEEDKMGRDSVVVLSDRLWSERFGRDPAVLGRKIVLDGNPFEVIGVMPPGFVAPRISQLQSMVLSDEYAQAWKPFAVRDYEQELMGDFNFGAIARLKPDVSLSQASAELNVIQAGISKKFAPGKTELLAAMTPLQEQLTGRTRQSLILLLAAVAAVLLIVCVNIANLMLARAAGRRRELAIRTAVGASTSRLVRQVLTESLLLAGMGGALGVLLASAGLSVILMRAPVDLPRLAEVRMDWQVAGFALFMTLASGLLFGVLPAWRMARTDPQAALKGGSQTITESRRGGRLRRVLIAAEVALSATCLVVAGLLLHSFAQVMRVDRGFQTEHALAVTVSLPPARYPKLDDQILFVRALLDRVSAQPGVVAAGVSNVLPLGGEGYNSLVMPEGAHWPMLERPLADVRPTNPEFFHAMGIALLSGRIFQESDKGRPVAVVSPGLARRMWPGASPLGKRFWAGDETTPPIEVVGVVGDVRGVSLQKAPNPTVYLPYWQSPRRDVGLVVRTAMDPGGIAATVRGEIRRLDPELPVPPFKTIAEMVDDSVAQRRFQLDLVLLFALAALVLAAVGVYGVISQSVAQRTNEIGIRMALGASAGSVWGLILRQGMAPVAIGLAAGLAASLAAGRLASGLLFGVRAADPLTLAAVPMVLLAAAAAACYVPARRATRVDPLVALHYE